MSGQGPESLASAGHWWRKIVFLAETIDIRELLLWADRYYIYGDGPLAFRLLLIDFFNSLVRSGSYHRRRNRMITERTEESLLFSFKKFCEEAGFFRSLREDLERLARGYDRDLMASNCKKRLVPYDGLVKEAFVCGTDKIVDCFAALAGTGRAQSRPFKLSSFMIHPSPRIAKRFLDAVSLEIPEAGQDRRVQSRYAEKPVLLIDGVYFCFAPHLVLPQVFDVVRGAVCSLGSGWKQKWDAIADSAASEGSPRKPDAPGPATTPRESGERGSSPLRGGSEDHCQKIAPDEEEEQPDYPKNISMEFDEFAPASELGGAAGEGEAGIPKDGSQEELPTSIQPTLFSQPPEETPSGAGGRVTEGSCLELEPGPESEKRPGPEPEPEPGPEPEQEHGAAPGPVAEPEPAPADRSSDQQGGEENVDLAMLLQREGEKGACLARTIQRMGNGKAAALGKKLGEAIAAWKLDGKEKLFSEMESGLSFCVASPLQDAVARMEMENALGALMLASERTEWRALVVKPFSEGLRTEILRIDKNLFEPWRWKTVRQMGWRLYLRIKDEKNL